ncbi:MAG TPA: APC family permease [Acidobacteriota bacterium]|jgi:amino acid transporter
MGTLDLTAAGVNGVVGAGIFLIPADVSRLLGPAGIWAYLIAGGAIALIVLCFAEAASRIQLTGGPYVYTRPVFGRFVGFQVGWMTWLARITGLAALSNGFSTYLGYFWPPAGGSQKMIAIVILIAFVTVMNVVGVRYGKTVVNALTVSKILPLSLFIVVGLFFVDWQRYQGTTLRSGDALGEATLLLVFALTGWEIVAIPAEEIKDPQRTLPAALLFTICFVTVFYVLIQLVAYGIFPGIENSRTPIASAAERLLGRAGGGGITLAALLSITGTCGGLMLAGPRMLYAFAAEGDIPKVFGKVHHNFRTPHVSILFTAACALAFAYAGNFAQMGRLAAVARLVSYVGVCAALPFLRRRPSESGIEPLKLPGGWVLPIAATACSIWLIASMQQQQLVLGLTAAGAGVVLYLAGRSAGKLPRSHEGPQNSI